MCVVVEEVKLLSEGSEFLVKCCVDGWFWKVF